MDYCDEVIEIKDNSSVDSLEEEAELREKVASSSFVRMQAAELLTKPDIKSINEVGTLFYKILKVLQQFMQSFIY